MFFTKVVKALQAAIRQACLDNPRCAGFMEGERDITSEADLDAFEARYINLCQPHATSDYQHVDIEISVHIRDLQDKCFRPSNEGPDYPFGVFLDSKGYSPVIAELASTNTVIWEAFPPKNNHYIFFVSRG